MMMPPLADPATAITFDPMDRLKRLEHALQAISRVALMPQRVSDRRVLVFIHDTAEDALSGRPVERGR